MMRRHAELLCRAHGGGAGLQGVPQARLVVPQGLRAPAASCATRWRWSTRSPTLDELLAELDPTEPFPVAELGTPRGRQGSPRRVVLPEGWLDDTDGTGCAVAEDMHSGG